MKFVPIILLLLCASVRAVTLVWQQSAPLPAGYYYAIYGSTNAQVVTVHMGDTGLAADNYQPTNFTKFYFIGSTTNKSFTMPRPPDLLLHGYAVCATNPVNQTSAFATTK